MNYLKTLKHFALLAIMLAPLAGFTQQLKIEQYQLSNGLTVILHEDHTRPEVFGVVAVKAGGKNDPADATGMAHYQEHLLFKGTTELGTLDWEKEKPHIDRIFSLYDTLGQTKDEDARKEIQKKINEESLLAANYAVPNELSNLIKSIGGTGLNAGTGADMTLYYSQVPSSQVEKWLEIYSHQFLNPVFRSFQAEVEVVYEEKNMYSDNFVMPLFEEFNRNFFKKHPYGQQTLIGTVDDLKNPSLTKMYEFFKTQYVANNMALVLSGDFSTQAVKPMIEEKFGRWRPGDVPPDEVYNEEPFNGRVLVERKMSPVKIGILGFRTVPKGHPDEIALNVCNEFLSNENQSGLLDRLVLSNKMLAAQALVMPYNDHGCTMILIVPKIMGQKLEEAETLVVEELAKLRNGTFEDWMLDAIKSNIYKKQQLQLETNQYVAVTLASAFGQNMEPEDVLSYPEKVNKITREDVIRVANAYYGNNYLAFFSKMGFPKKEKIEKPGYEPILANTEAKSAFAKRFESIPTPDPVIKYIDFDKDMETIRPKENLSLFAVKNPRNDVFSLKVKFGIGDAGLPMMRYASNMMNYSGAGGYSLDSLKQQFSKVGCSYQVGSDESYTWIEIEGLDSRLPESLELLALLISKPVLDSSKIKMLLEEEKASRKMERSGPDFIDEALKEYVLYGEHSEYLDRLGMKEIKKLTVDTLIKTFLEATRYAAEIHYCGTLPGESLKELVLNHLLPDKTFIAGTPPVDKEPRVFAANTVYFLNNSKAVQSKVHFFINGKPYDYRESAQMDAFNTYFGGDFSGLVLQEIREYRSMAYTAGARFTTPKVAGRPTRFEGYLGTQADKTNDAIDVFAGLVSNMPEKSERMDMIREYLGLSSLTQRPHFRDLSESVEAWKYKGYTADPARFRNEAVKTLAFDDIVVFYKQNVKAKPMAISIIGNKKQLNLDALEKYGNIVKIKENSLYKD